MSWLHEVRWRLTLWYAATLAVGLCLFAVTSLVVISRVLNSRADRFLRDARGGFLVELAVEANEYPDDHQAIRMAVHEIRFEETQFLVYSAASDLVSMSGDAGNAVAVVSASTAVPLVPRKLATSLDTLALRGVVSARAGSVMHTDDALTIQGEIAEYRVVIGGASVHGRAYTVLAVQDRTEYHETMRRVAAAYAFGVPLLILGAIGGGYFLARRALAPVGAMAERAREIGANNLHARLPVGDQRDELGGLAQVVNELLSRLEAAFQQQHRFVADASHELRTPVAILQAESEVALSRDRRSEAEYRDALSVVNKSSQRLSRIVEDLFLLARADAGHLPVHVEAMYLDELLADSARALRSVASRAGVQIELTTNIDNTGAPFNGSPSLLDRLILNLLDNALKYSSPGGVVRVNLSRSRTNYEIAIADGGPGIPVAAQPHIFERFFRVDPARSRLAFTQSDGESHSGDKTAADADVAPRAVTASGAGLGLAISRWIAEAHGGTLELRYSSAIGSEFVVTLPVPDAIPEKKRDR